MTDQRKQSQSGERTDGLYPAMQRRSDGSAARDPDTSGDKPSDSRQAASHGDKDRQP
jgi:hypothetical protein